MMKEQTMPTRNVVLTSYQDALVTRMVDSGIYQNASEVLREGLRLIERREAEDTARLVALRQAVHTGMMDFEARKYSTFETRAELGAYLKSIAAKAMDDV
jgi:antitoxin ParD1/3/4